jgi:hypothetical protein
MKTTTKKRRGRPPKGSAEVKSESILLRLAVAEKSGFRAASDVAGLELSVWIRERLRLAARKELESAGQPVPFIQRAG